MKPASYDEKTTPAIMIDGQLWPVPRLAPRQLREIWADVNELTAALDGVGTDGFGERVLRLSNEQFAKIQNVVFWGLRRAHPDMKEDEFLDMQASPPDLVSAFLVVRAQTGMFRVVPVGPVPTADPAPADQAAHGVDDPAPGEAVGPAQAPAQIGID